MQPTGLTTSVGWAVTSAPVLLELAESTRWRSPEATAVLAEHAAVAAWDGGDASTALLAEGWLVQGLAAAGQGTLAVPRGVEALSEASRADDLVASDRLRVALAGVARTLGGRDAAMALLAPVLNRPGLSGPVRSDARIEAALCEVDRFGVGQDSPPEAVLTAVGRAGAEYGELGLAGLEAVLAQQRRSTGRSRDAVRHAQDGLRRVLGEQPDSATLLRPTFPYLAATLAVELALALLDEGQRDEAQEIAGLVRRWDGQPGTLVPLARLRLGLARRVLVPTGAHEEALTSVRRVAAEIEGRGLLELEVDCYSLLAELYEATGELPGAMAASRRAHAAYRDLTSEDQRSLALLESAARRSGSSEERRAVSLPAGSTAGSETGRPALLARSAGGPDTSALVAKPAEPATRAGIGANWTVSAPDASNPLSYLDAGRRAQVSPSRGSGVGDERPSVSLPGPAVTPVDEPVDRTGPGVGPGTGDAWRATPRLGGQPRLGEFFDGASPPRGESRRDGVEPLGTANPVHEGTATPMFGSTGFDATARLSLTQLAVELIGLSGPDGQSPHVVLIDIVAPRNSIARPAVSALAQRVAALVAEQLPRAARLFLLEQDAVAIALPDEDAGAVVRWARSVASGLSPVWSRLAAELPRATFRIDVQRLDARHPIIEQPPDQQIGDRVLALEQRLESRPDHVTRDDGPPALVDGHGLAGLRGLPAAESVPEPGGRHVAGDDSAEIADFGRPVHRVTAPPGSGGRRRRAEETDVASAGAGDRGQGVGWSGDTMGDSSSPGSAGASSGGARSAASQGGWPGTGELEGSRRDEPGDTSRWASTSRNGQHHAAGPNGFELSLGDRRSLLDPPGTPATGPGDRTVALPTVHRAAPSTDRPDASWVLTTEPPTAKTPDRSGDSISGDATQPSSELGQRRVADDDHPWHRGGDLVAPDWRPVGQQPGSTEATARLRVGDARRVERPASFLGGPETAHDGGHQADRGVAGPSGRHRAHPIDDGGNTSPATADAGSHSLSSKSPPAADPAGRHVDTTPPDWARRSEPEAGRRPDQDNGKPRPVSELSFGELIAGALAAYREG